MLEVLSILVSRGVFSFDNGLEKKNELVLIVTDSSSNLGYDQSF